LAESGERSSGLMESAHLASKPPTAAGRVGASAQHRQAPSRLFPICGLATPLVSSRTAVEPVNQNPTLITGRLSHTTHGASEEKAAHDGNAAHSFSDHLKVKQPPFLLHGIGPSAPAPAPRPHLARTSPAPPCRLLVGWYCVFLQPDGRERGSTPVAGGSVWTLAGSPGRPVPGGLHTQVHVTTRTCTCAQ
jgi:hypothetical protein